MRRASSTLALGLLVAMLASAGCRVTLPTARPPSSPPSNPGAEAPTEAGAPFDAAAAAAAGEDVALEALLEPGPWEVETFLTTLILPDVPVAGGTGEVDTVVNRFRIKFAKNFGMGAFVTLESAYENRVYTFGNLEGVLPETGVPTAAFHGLGFRVRYLQAVSRKWAGFLFARVRCEWEAGVEPTDGLSWAISPGIGHRLDNGMNLGIGLAFVDRIASDLLIIPGPQFTWDIDERWSMELVGTEFLLEHHATPQWTLALAAGFDSPRTRLHRSEPGNYGIFTDSRIPVQLRATWTPWECTSLELRVGVDVYRRLFYSDRYGNSLFTQQLDPSLHVGLRWQMRF